MSSSHPHAEPPAALADASCHADGSFRSGRRSAPRVLIFFYWSSEALVKGAMKYCVDHGLSPLCADMTNIDTLRPGDFDCVVGMLPPPSHRLHRLIVDSGVPVVELTLAYPENESWGRFHSDGVQAGRMAARHLKQTRSASFVFVGNSTSPMDMLRENGFRSGLADDLGRRRYVFFDVLSAAPVWTGLSGVSPFFVRFLHTMPKPVGVFVTVDDTARWACDTALAAGLEIPRDLLLMGYGNRELVSGMAPVPITSIAIDYFRWAYEATEMLAGMLAGRLPSGARKVFSSGNLIVRDSTGGDAGGDPLCVRAIGIMRENFARVLSIEDISGLLTVSPTTLKRAFQTHLGAGVAAHYLALRIDYAKGLLVSGAKVEAVSGMVGFASPSAFHRAFYKVTRKTPGEFAASAVS